MLATVAVAYVKDTARNSYICKIGCQETEAPMAAVINPSHTSPFGAVDGDTARNWDGGLARRTKSLGGGEITAILALAGASDVITFSGHVLADIAGQLITEDPGVALQYSATEGIASVRDYVCSRLAAAQGRAPGPGELMITSGGIDCMELVAKSYLDAGDAVVVEAPTYLGAIMAFRGYEADVRGVPVDGDGLRTDVLADLLAAG